MQPLAWAASLGAAKIYLYCQPVDMRKSFDGLHALVQTEFQRDIRAGDLFLFLNRRLDRLKLLHWDQDGIAIWMKRLEVGTFQKPRRALDATQIEIDATDLALLLVGIDLATAKRRRRYRANTPARVTDEAQRGV